MAKSYDFSTKKEAVKLPSDPLKGYKVIGWEGESVLFVSPVGMTVAVSNDVAMAKLDSATR